MRGSKVFPGSRGPLDHDIFTDHAGRIYFVLGHYQPRDRVISILKYVPDPSGTWMHRETGVTYLRSYWHQGVDVFLKTESFVKSTGHEPLQLWLVRDPVFGTDYLEVPVGSIREYLLPEERLDGICRARDESLDPLERKVKHVVTTLATTFEPSGIKATDFGITGSVLWNGHSERSDININVYGKHACRKLHDALAARAAGAHSLSADLSVVMKGFDDVPFLSRDPSLPGTALSRKPKLKMAGFTPGIQLRWCLRRGELPVTYGTERYRELGVQRFTLQVIDDEYAMFYPAFVGVRTIEGHLDARRIMVYDTRVTRFFKINDVVSVTATVQEVTTTGGDTFFQLLIGSKAHAQHERVILLSTTSGR